MACTHLEIESNIRLSRNAKVDPSYVFLCFFFFFRLLVGFPTYLCCHSSRRHNKQLRNSMPIFVMSGTVYILGQRIEFYVTNELDTPAPRVLNNTDGYTCVMCSREDVFWILTCQVVYLSYWLILVLRVDWRGYHALLRPSDIKTERHMHHGNSTDEATNGRHKQNPRTDIIPTRAHICANITPTRSLEPTLLPFRKTSMGSCFFLFFFTLWKPILLRVLYLARGSGTTIDTR